MLTNHLKCNQFYIAIELIEARRDLELASPPRVPARASPPRVRLRRPRHRLLAAEARRDLELAAEVDASTRASAASAAGRGIEVILHVRIGISGRDSREPRPWASRARMGTGTQTGTGTPWGSRSQTSLPPWGSRSRTSLPPAWAPQPVPETGAGARWRCVA
jgi:hypothetical protein